MTSALWDPETVLDVHPNDHIAACIGTAVSTRRRCRKPIGAPRCAQASDILDELSYLKPTKVAKTRKDDLYALAGHQLCNFHTGDASEKVALWVQRINKYADGGMVQQRAPLGDVTALKGNKNLGAQREGLEALYDELQREYKQYKQDVVAEKDLIAARAAQFKTKVEAVENEKDALEIEMTVKLDIAKDELVETRKKLRRSRDDKKAEVSRREEVEVQLESLQADSTKLLERSKELKNDINELKNENKEMKSRNNDLTAKNSQLKTENNDLKSENTNLKTETNILATANSLLRKEIADSEQSTTLLLKEKDASIAQLTENHCATCYRMETAMTAQAATMSDLQRRHGELLDLKYQHDEDIHSCGFIMTLLKIQVLDAASFTVSHAVSAGGRLRARMRRSV